MLRVGIEICDGNYCHMDLSQPEKGNPGIGGSEYEFLMLGRYIQKELSNIQVVYFYYGLDNILPQNVGGGTCKQSDGIDSDGREKQSRYSG